MRRGVEPQLSLNYSSHNHDGILGLGWGLELSVASYSTSDKLKNQQSLALSSSVTASTGSPTTPDGSGDIAVSGVPAPTADPYPHNASLEFPAPMVRCARTVAQDGVHGSVNYDANDRFCLNGKRLILVSGTYGADGSQYRTEIDEFSEIIAHGQSGSGPAWFEVHTKSGQILQFGNTTNSKAPLVPVSGSTTGPTGTVRVWGVNRISDVQGNYLTITYNNGTPDTTNGQIYPTEIDYTGNPNASPTVTPYNHVYFYYNTSQTRPDIVPIYQAGSLTQTTVLLTEIKTYSGSTLVYDYKLAYNLASSNASNDELSSLTLCDVSGNCLSPTTFRWQGSLDKLTMTGVPVTLPGLVAPSSSYGSVSRVTNNFISGDFNGDGIADFAIVPSSSGSSYSINIYLGNSTPGSFGSAVTTSVPTSSTGWPQRFQTLDVNGDGVADIFYEQTNCTAGAHLYESIGAGSLTSLGTIPCYTTVGGISAQNTLQPGADFNGDGYADYFADAITTTSGSGHQGTGYIGNGSGSFTQIGSTVQFGAGYQVIVNSDFDGDGCSDTALYATSGNVINYSCASAVSTITLPTNLATCLGITIGNLEPRSPAYGNQVVVGDFNGDGRADILCVPDQRTYSSTVYATLYLSTGTGFAPAITIPNSTDWYMYNISAGDWNGDGKTDLIFVAPNDYSLFYGTGTPHQLWLSTGTGFVQAEDPNGNPVTIANTSSLDVCSMYPTCITAEVANWNGDSAQDVLLVRASGSEQYNFSFVPTLLVGVSNGIGNVTNVTYDRINKNASLYTKCPNSPTSYFCGDAYPTQAFDGPLYVVSRTDASNGLGTCTPPSMTSCYSTTYAYGGAKKDLSGRGFLGFQMRVETDLQTGIVTTRNYLTAFPYTGLLASETKVTTAASSGCTSGVTLSSTTNTPGAVNLGGTRNFVYTSQTVVAQKDCNGASLPTVTTANQYDCQSTPSACYGELDVETVTRSDGSSKTTTKAYGNDTTDWCLDRPTSSVVNSIVGSSNMTRTTTYQWTSCLLRQQAVEPSSSTLRIIENYTPDAFGNITGTTVTGSNFTSRSTSATYDSQGKFQATATDELGHVDTYVHDARFGGLTSDTDPNLATTTWAYDTFGRLSNEAQPDGTQTQFSYTYCSGVNGGSGSCPTHGAFLSQALPTASNGATQIGPLSTEHYDMLSRRIAADTQGLDGSTIRISTPYDALGRIAEASRPYFLSGGTPQWTVNTYDALARVTLAVAPNGGDTTTVYNGLSVSVTNADSQTTTTTKNAEGQIASVTDALGHTTAYAYDAFGDLVSITDPVGNATAYTYDIRGHRLSSNDPDLGSSTYSYDALGEMTGQTDAKGQSFSMSYDLKRRLVGSVEPDLTSTWTYDTAPHGINKLASASTNTGYLRSLTYDSLSRPIQTALTEGGTNFTYTTSYNTTNGQIGSIGYPSGFGVTYVYSSLGYLSQINDSSSGQNYWMVNTRDAELHLLQQTFGNGVVQSNAFNSQTGLLTSIRSGPSNSVAAFDYQYDLLGNLLYRDDTIQSVYEYYCFDALNRLTTSASGVNGGTASACTSSGANIIGKSIGFDALGDITTKSDVGTYSYPAAGHAHPHAVTSIAGTVNGVANPTFSYDANGNMTSGAGRTVSYTSYNLASALTEGATSITYAYDSEHARIQQVGPGGTTTYLNDLTSGAMSEQVVNGSTTTWHDFILAPEEGALVAERLTGPTLLYFTVDPLSSIAVVTNASAGVTERDSYDAWGRRRNSNGTDNTVCAVTSATTRGYTGQEMMDSVCAVNLNARVYDPTIARFMAADPIDVDSYYDLQELNRYAYVDNGPLNNTDVTGNDGCPAGQDCQPNQQSQPQQPPPPPPKSAPTTLSEVLVVAATRTGVIDLAGGGPAEPVGVVGFMMLTGRLNWRYGATVILGCFILFGAASIRGAASGARDLASNQGLNLVGWIFALAAVAVVVGSIIVACGLHIDLRRKGRARGLFGTARDAAVVGHKWEGFWDLQDPEQRKLLRRILRWHHSR